MGWIGSSDGFWDDFRAGLLLVTSSRFLWAR